MLVLQGSAATLTMSFTNDEVTAVPTSAVTVNVYDNDTNVLAQSGGTVANGSAWDYLLVPTGLALGIYRVEWTATFGAYSQTVKNYVEVVGAFPCTLGEMRGTAPTLADATKYPTSALVAAREAALDEFQAILGFSLVPRGNRYVEDTEAANGYWYRARAVQTPLGMVRKVTAVTDSAAFSATVDLTKITVDKFGTIDYSIGFAGRVTVDYEHGLDVIPGDLKRAFLAYCAYRLHADRGNAVPERAESFTAAEGGTFRLAVAGRAGYKTGLPEVDAVLDRYTMKAGIY